MHEISDGKWRRALNGAIRTFVSAAAGAGDGARQTLVGAILREIGDTLKIDCAVLLPLSHTTHRPRHHHWFPPFAQVNGGLFDVPVFQTLLSQINLDRTTVLLTSE